MERRTLFRIIALLLAPAALAAAEGVLWWRERGNVTERGKAVWTVPDEWLGYRLRRDFATPDGRAFINGEGIRGDSLHLAAAPGDPRILVLGNSCAFGAGCMDTEIFTYLLERNLRAGGLESAVVYNAGVGGYNTNQCRLYLERELGRYRPTDIVVYAGWNDLVTATWPFYVPGLQLGPKARPPGGELMIPWISSLRLFNFARARWRMLLNRLRSDGGHDTWNARAVDNFRSNLVAMKAEAARLGARIHFCTLPYDEGRFPERYSREAFGYSREGFVRLWSAFQSEIRSAAAPEALIDLHAAVAPDAARSEVIYDYNHLGPEGHAIAAATIERALRDAWSRARTPTASREAGDR